jgi:hypothetical protein
MSEHDYYQAHARLDAVLDTFPNGVHVQEIELLMLAEPAEQLERDPETWQ